MISFREMLLQRRLWGLVRDQHEVICQQRDQLAFMREDRERLRLEYARNVRDLVEQFFVAQESGQDVRDQLQAGLRDLQDEVARLEEHHVQ